MTKKAEPTMIPCKTCGEKFRPQYSGQTECDRCLMTGMVKPKKKQ